MARLTAAQRKKLPKKAFAGPSRDGGPGRSFPMNDRAHIIAAKREEKFASPATKKKINARAKAAGIGGRAAKPDPKPVSKKKK